MKVYKEKQFLVFDYEDGKTVKYDFATKSAIGKSGKEVKSLNSQLQGYTVENIFECCENKQYAKFLKFIQKNGSKYGGQISNIGTILNRVPDYARFEQLFSAGVDDIVDLKYFKYSINDISKGLINLCRTHKLGLSNDMLEIYKLNPNACQDAFKIKCISLDDHDINLILTRFFSKKVGEWRYERTSIFNELLKEYGYTVKGLINYFDYLKTYEALDDISFILTDLYDYAFMMNKISSKFDKYPRHFLTTHKIACRNYNRLKEHFIENDFQKQITPEMEKTFGEYQFIYPKSTSEIKEEAVQQNNCVASYIERVINGECHILFLRKKNALDKSLVTIEVRNGKIVQARRRFNDPVNDEQQIVIDKWNKWYANKNKEDLKNAC